MNNKVVSILGSTGSVGIQSVEVVKHLGYKADILMASSSVDLIEKQARELRPDVCILTDEKAADLLKVKLADTSVKVYSGMDSAVKVIEESKSDIAINAVSGFSGLYPAMACARSGKSIAMSNKEAIVVAYDFLYNELKKTTSELIPVDSEHSAIFQCLQGNKNNRIKKIILTSSGGPFRGKKREEIQRTSSKEALSHPTWKMGAKITVDSASLMNKGFEVIEAVRLFDVKPSQIEVVVHPQSIIHSAVEYIDNCIIAQMGMPDMRTCIQYALTYPERSISLSKELSFSEIGKLTFENPDTETFSLLPLAFYAVERGGIIPAVLNASDEIAVSLFLQGRIMFTDIFDIVEKVVKESGNIKTPSLDEIIQTDAEARLRTKEIAEKYIKTGK